MTGAAAVVVESAPRVFMVALAALAVGVALGYVAGYGNGARAVVRALDEPTFLDRERRLAQLRAAMGLPRQGGYPVALAPAEVTVESSGLDPEPTSH